MTCIVGLIDKENDCVMICGDSAASFDDHVERRTDTKVFSNGNFIFGCTTSFRMIQLLRFTLELREPEPDEDLYKYMCTDFINSVRTCLQGGGFLSSKDGEEIGGTFLVAYGNRLFKVDSDFNVAENIDPYNACGCGESYALGSLHTTGQIGGFSTRERIIKAMNAAEYYSGGVTSPFTLVYTQKKETI